MEFEPLVRGKIQKRLIIVNTMKKKEKKFIPIAYFCTDFALF